MSFLLLLKDDGLKSPVASGLKALYLLKEGSGQTVADSSGGGRNGTLGSTAGADANDPSWVSAGLSFTTDDYVNCGTDAALLSNAWSICAAMKLTAGAISSLAGWSTTQQYPAVYGAAPYNANRPLIWLNADTWRYFDKTTPVNVQDGGWHFFVFSCPGNSAADINSTTLRVDGLNQPAFSSSALAGGTAKAVFRIGNAGGTRYFAGSLAFLSFHDRVLTTTEQDEMRSYAKQELKGRVTLP